MGRLMIVGIIGWVIGLSVVPAAGQGSAQARPCEEERDQLRVLIRMIGDQRSQLEVMASEAFARLQRAEAEILRLKAVPAPPDKQ